MSTKDSVVLYDWSGYDTWNIWKPITLIWRRAIFSLSTHTLLFQVSNSILSLDDLCHCFSNGLFQPQQWPCQDVREHKICSYTQVCSEDRNTAFKASREACVYQHGWQMSSKRFHFRRCQPGQLGTARDSSPRWHQMDDTWMVICVYFEEGLRICFSVKYELI